MANGRSHEAWMHTASVMAIVANTVRDPKKRSRPYTVKDFHPEIVAAGRGRNGAVKITPQNIDILRRAFVGTTKP